MYVVVGVWSVVVVCEVMCDIDGVEIVMFEFVDVVSVVVFVVWFVDVWCDVYIVINSVGIMVCLEICLGDGREV